MDNDQIVERIAAAIYEASRQRHTAEGLPLPAWSGMTEEQKSDWWNEGRAAIAEHKAALAELGEADIEPIVKADFMENAVYGSYYQEGKEAEWQRMRRIEFGSFRRRWRAMLGADPDQR